MLMSFENTNSVDENRTTNYLNGFVAKDSGEADICSPLSINAAGDEGSNTDNLQSIESLLEAPVENILTSLSSNSNSNSDTSTEAGGVENAADGTTPSEETSTPTEDVSPIAISFENSIDLASRSTRTQTIYGISQNSGVNDGNPEDKFYDPERVRKVKFLEPIVSGSMPAKLFQREAVLSKEELIHKYKSACEATRTKPINSVISSIEKAKSIDERIKELTLKGEKIDGRSAEALEVIFRHAQFITLDLENCYLEDNVAIVLFEMIDYYEIATRIKIGANNKLSQFAWMHLCQMVKKCPFVESLDCSYTEFQDSSAILLARIIRNNCNLVALHLMNCKMSGKFLNYLVVGLRSNYILQELYLGDNLLIPSDALLLSQLLKTNFKLECLDLRNNNLGDKGAASIFDGLKEQGQTGVGLVSLILWNNNLTPNCHYVLYALANHRSLETLNMGYNDLRNEGVALLKDGLMKNKSVAKLGLSSTRIDSIGAIALAEYIAESQSIVRVDIRNNNVKVAGIMALQNALKNNYTLTRLDIDSEPKREQLPGYVELYSKCLEQIMFLLERNQTLASEEDTRRFVLQQQMVSYRRGLTSSFTTPSANANNGDTTTTVSSAASATVTSNSISNTAAAAANHNTNSTLSSPSSPTSSVIPPLSSSSTSSKQTAAVPRSKSNEPIRFTDPQTLVFSSDGDNVPIILPPKPEESLQNTPTSPSIVDNPILSSRVNQNPSFLDDQNNTSGNFEVPQTDPTASVISNCSQSDGKQQQHISSANTINLPSSSSSSLLPQHEETLSCGNLDDVTAIEQTKNQTEASRAENFPATVDLSSASSDTPQEDSSDRVIAVKTLSPNTN